MRMRKFFYALGIGCMLSACSSHEEPSRQEQPDFSKGNKCISISVVTTAGDDTRAGDDEIVHDPYEDGDPAEYDIKSVGLYLFNRQGECVDAEYYTPANFSRTDTPDDENLTTLCTIEVELSGNRVYDRIIAVLNPNSELVNGNGLISMSEDDLIKYRDAYSGKFTMSNSVYINDAHYSGTAGAACHIAAPIGAENIYTKEKEEKDMTEAELTALNNTRKEKGYQYLR